MEIPPRSRLFVALAPPPPVRRALAERAREIALRVDGRPVPTESIHLTLAFLGQVDPERAGALEEALRASLAGPPLRAGPGELLALPAPARARLVAYRPDDPGGAIARRAEAVRAATARATGMPPPARPFLAHMTLVRRRRPGRIGAEALDGPMEQVFAFSRAALYHSVPRGDAPPRYEALVTLDLE